MTTVLTEPSAAPTRPIRPRTATASPRNRRIILHTMQVMIIVTALSAWEFGAHSGAISSFLFGSPSAVWNVLQTRAISGELWSDIGVTSTEVILGFLIGAVGGSVLGLLLWYSQFVADLTSPFIAAIGSIPVLAVAPLTIIWFGTEMTSKVVIVAFSCVVVSLATSYRGARRTDPDLINLMKSFGASRSQIFRKLVVPSAMTWVVSGLKLNIGFALVGAIVGEYISSDAGVGHMILLGSSNFTISLVIAGIAIVMVMVLVFNLLVSALERFLSHWERS
jgi:NitT/TauT family transport system permease protein